MTYQRRMADTALTGIDMTDADQILIEQLKVVVDHCTETGLNAGAVAVKNAIVELARLRDALESALKPHFEVIENNEKCLVELARLRQETSRQEACNADLLVTLNVLTQKYDSLAAENRVMRGTIAWALDDSETGGGWGPDVTIASRLSKALDQPHTAREVERVKALEAVVGAEKRMCSKSMLRGCTRHTDEEEAALDKLSKDGDK